jgi:hypothetical protein
MKRAILLITVLALSAVEASAHEGPRFWIGNVGGKITTFRSDNDLNPTIYWPCRLFTTELELFFNVNTTEFPGYEVRQSGGNVAVGTTFGFNITGPALYFDESSNTFVTTLQEFGLPQPGAVPQLAVSLGANVRATSTGPVSGFDFFTFNSIGDHSHLAYTLLGDGSTASDGPSGIYAISLNLTSTSLTTSETYYLLLGKDVEQGDPLFDLAFDVARHQLIGVGVPGDMDCSGTVGLEDIADFVDAVLSGMNSGSLAPACCSLRTADMNQDQKIDGLDIRQFAAALLTP